MSEEAQTVVNPGDILPHSGYVGIIGRPNVGKSTLLNQILGRKVAITTSTPQTTRRRILGVATGASHQLVLVDTPGVHRSTIPLNRNMVSEALSVLGDVDIVWLMVDATVTESANVSRDLKLIMQPLERVQTPVFLVINKVDAVSKPALLPMLAKWNERRTFEELVPVSALKGEGVDTLVDATVALLPEGPAFFPSDVYTDQDDQMFLAELVRERILNRTREEVPHAAAVTVDEIDLEDPDDPESRLLVHATIYVERDGQKGILIGKRGALLKTIGTDARQEMMAILGRRVHLELFVKVERNWRRNPRILRDLGLGQ